ncbi:MAG: class I SAM-dependent methyltransferase [Alphaproteobacteria bacterium]|nr:class I SAM-dependent methyltransferase [Alphaproteobacteria bacterium]
MNELARRLSARIASHGALRVDAFIDACLADPEFGYYRTRAPLGASGDFTTAPEISQAFGEMLGLWLGERWQAAGSPPSVRLVELGPGRGVLMADALRALGKVLPGFVAAARLHLVEISRPLRAQQAEQLAGHAPSFHDTFDEVPDDGPVFVVANEFFDALPVRQFVRRGAVWHERVVSSPADGFAFADGPRVDDPPLSREQIDDAPDGTVVEVCEPALAIARQIGARLARTGGAAIIVDYGTARSGWGDTLQAVRAHNKVPVFEAPGECDLTTHVDFPRLVNAARTGGADAFGPVTQADFLRRVGIHARFAVLARGASPERARTLEAASRRLLHPDEMGTLFKAVAFQAPTLPPPPGFEG